MRCLDRRVLISLGAVGLTVLVVRPALLGAVLPLLVVLACPLSMLLMMRRTRGDGSATKLTLAPGGSSELDDLRAELTRLRAEVQARSRSNDLQQGEANRGEVPR